MFWFVLFLILLFIYPLLAMLLLIIGVAAKVFCK